MSAKVHNPRSPVWAEQVPEEQWERYRAVIRSARERGIGFAVGGGFAMAAYIGRLRSTKDLDLYVHPEDREAMIQVLTENTWCDYFAQNPYDRNWIYRAWSDDTILDVIWSMPNQRANVDRRWIEDGPEICLRGEWLKVVPPEEMIWAKLYVMQRDRCDWPDVLNLVWATAPKLDWDRLISRMEADAPLLKAALEVFTWLSPSRARAIPARVWEHFGLTRPEPEHGEPHREHLLDTREWFRPATPDRKAS